MLNSIAGLGGLFGNKGEGHPLATARQLKAVIDAVPRDNAFKALDEVLGWIESLRGADEFPAERLFETVRQLDDVAQPHLRRLAREYLHTARLTRSDEKRLWAINHGFWLQLAQAYERCLDLLGQKDKAGEAIKQVLPLLATRLIGALAALIKWDQFHYGPSEVQVWQRMGQALLLAEGNGVATKSVPNQGMQPGMSHAQGEFIKAVAFQAASMDSLLPLEIELAERLIEKFLPSFVFSSQSQIDSVYWVDLAAAQAPQRLARMPAEARPTQRFFKPAQAHAQFKALLAELEQGGELSPEIALGGQFPPRVLIPVLQHLVAYLAPVPPQRSHDRHRVKHRISVLNGLINAFVVFSSEFGGRPAGLQIESWVVENVSRGGFGALLSNIPGEWLKVGALLAMQPEGGDNWLLGIVRRYHRESELEARIGIQTLATKAVAIECRPRTSSSYGAAATLPALLVRDGNQAGEVRVVLPANSFDLRESLDYQLDGQRFLLSPVELLEQTVDYEVARYRQLVAD
ncbi:MAG: hypothetical protein PHV02_02360 [Rhodocyclaceae bacterium]|nr:hypothetical protein [Rhodocyclaceae bacterium]